MVPRSRRRLSPHQTITAAATAAAAAAAAAEGARPPRTGVRPPTPYDAARIGIARDRTCWPPRPIRPACMARTNGRGAGFTLSRFGGCPPSDPVPARRNRCDYNIIIIIIVVLQVTIIIHCRTVIRAAAIIVITVICRFSRDLCDRFFAVRLRIRLDGSCCCTRILINRRPLNTPRAVKRTVTVWYRGL